MMLHAVCMTVVPVCVCVYSEHDGHEYPWRLVITFLLMSLPVGAPATSRQPPYKLRRGGNRTNMDRKTLEDSYKIKIGSIMGWYSVMIVTPLHIGSGCILCVEAATASLQILRRPEKLSCVRSRCRYELWVGAGRQQTCRPCLTMFVRNGVNKSWRKHILSLSCGKHLQ